MTDRRRRTLELSLFLAIGLAAGWLIPGNDPAPLRATSPPTRVSDPPGQGGTIAVRDGPVPTSEALPPGPAAPAAADGLPPLDGDIEALLDWARGEPPPELGPATGTIEGRVTRDGGAPVAGARIEIWCETAEGYGGYGPDHVRVRDAPWEARPALERALLRYRWQNATRREATSDADGRFAFRALPCGEDDEPLEFAFRATAPDHVLTAFVDGELMEWRLPVGSFVDMRAEATFEVRAEVVDGRGRALPEARIYASGRPDIRPWADGGDHPESRDDSLGFHWWVSDDPVLRLRSGAWSLVAESQDWRSRSEPVEVVASAPGRGEPITLVVQDGAGCRRGVRVHVQRPPGEREGDLAVRLLRVAPHDPPMTAGRLANARCRRWDEADHTEPLELPGRYAIGAGRRSDVVEVLVEVDVPDEGIVDVDLALAEPDPEDTLTVRVTDPEGRPVDEAEVGLRAPREQREHLDELDRALAEMGGPLESVWGVAHRRGPGEHVLSGEAVARALRLQAERGKRLVVTVASPGYTRHAVDVPAGARVVDVRLEPPGKPCMLTVTPVGWEPRVRLLVADRGEVHPDTRADGEGVVFMVPRPADGILDASLCGSSEGFGELVALSLPVAIGPEEAHVELPRPPLHRLTVALSGEGEIGERQVRLTAEGQRPEDRFGSTYIALASGRTRATFDRLPAGRYRVDVLGRGLRIMGPTIEVPGTEEVVLRGRANAVRVTRDEEAPGLLEGDVIVALGGEPFSTGDPVTELLRAAVHGPLDLRVIRNQQALDVRADLRAVLAEALVLERSLQWCLEPAAIEEDAR